MSYEKTMQSVADAIENEGFDYAFVNYSNFEEIEDEEFHRLRIAYKEARAELEAYVEANAEGSDDDEWDD